MTDGTAIAISGLTFTYPDGRPALRGVDLRVAAGEKVALVGPNGAGKSTLLMNLNGLLRGDGSIRVFDREVSNGDGETLREVRAIIGTVFSDPDDQLFSPTVSEDVAFGPLYMGLSAEEVRARVDEALQQVGLETFHDRMPHHLSSGEKKRAAIATVLSMRPRVLAMDEPTAGLDPRSRRGFMEMVRALPQAVLAATHDMHFVRDTFDRTVILNAGTVAADGPTSDVLADGDLLEANGLEMP
jgi:cobalt/nickel transport system ATP-binding protein